jgi:hypothetical protein
MLIDRERDDAAILNAEDEAIREAEKGEQGYRTGLDELTELLSAPVQQAPEGDGGDRRRDDQPQGRS